jgi:hypothetical protein
MQCSAYKAKDVSAGTVCADRTRASPENRSNLMPRDPLFRLLLTNLAAGLAAAVLLFGGLLLLNPANLRDLILSDRSPETALLLLLFGFVITFGSAAMGTAIMTMGGRKSPPPSGRRTATRPVAVRARA